MKLLKSFIAILIILVSINTAIAKTLTVDGEKLKDVIYYES